MKIQVLFKRLDKHTGEVKSTTFRSFDKYDPVAKCKVLNSIIDMINRKVETESIFQIETFLEHEVTELDMF